MSIIILWLFQVTYPLCTIANTPRLPEHCIEYAKVIQWPKENPFDCVIDGDDPQHINWIFEKSNERASQFGIRGPTYRLVQGVVKNIIPAVASTNATIAATCATEVFKLASNCSPNLNNYMVFFYFKINIHEIKQYVFDDQNFVHVKIVFVICRYWTIWMVFIRTPTRPKRKKIVWRAVKWPKSWRSKIQANASSRIWYSCCATGLICRWETLE